MSSAITNTLPTTEREQGREGAVSHACEGVLGSDKRPPYVLPHLLRLDYKKCPAGAQKVARCGWCSSTHSTPTTIPRKSETWVCVDIYWYLAAASGPTATAGHDVLFVRRFATRTLSAAAPLAPCAHAPVLGQEVVVDSRGANHLLQGLGKPGSYDTGNGRRAQRKPTRGADKLKQNEWAE